MKRVVGFGAGGHAEVILEILLENAGIDVAGLLDLRPERSGATLRGVPILGGDDKLDELVRSGITHAFNGVGGFGSAEKRRKIYERACEAGLDIICVLHPRAIISRSAEIGDGTVIFAGAVISSAARIGRNVIVNTGATVDHHCVIADHVHIAPGAHLAGGIVVGQEAQIGIGASVREGVRIGCRAVIGAGAAVVSDVPDNMLALGVPARPRPKK